MDDGPAGIVNIISLFYLLSPTISDETHPIHLLASIRSPLHWTTIQQEHNHRFQHREKRRLSLPCPFLGKSFVPKVRSDITC